MKMSNNSRNELYSVIKSKWDGNLAIADPHFLSCPGCFVKSCEFIKNPVESNGKWSAIIVESVEGLVSRKRGFFSAVKKFGEVRKTKLTVKS